MLTCFFAFFWTKCRHNLFLHSALVLSRKIPGSKRGINVSHPWNRQFLFELVGI
jgi:hypothetical protein